MLIQGNKNPVMKLQVLAAWIVKLVGAFQTGLSRFHWWFSAQLSIVRDVRLILIGYSSVITEETVHDNIVTTISIYVCNIRCIFIILRFQYCNISIFQYFNIFYPSGNINLCLLSPQTN